MRGGGVSRARVEQRALLQDWCSNKNKNKIDEQGLYYRRHSFSTYATMICPDQLRRLEEGPFFST